MAMDMSPQHPSGLPRSQSSSLTNLSQILPYLQNQESYAAALRRTRVTSTLQVTPITYSRSSSPTQFGLTLSSMSLQSSKGSSASSTASDSPSERDRVRNRTNKNYFYQNAHGSPVQRSGGKSYQASNGKYYKTYTAAQSHPRTHDYKTHRNSPSQSRHIPGMPVPTTQEVNGEESKVNNDGGWIKVDYSKKNHKQPIPTKSKKDRPKASGRSR